MAAEENKALIRRALAVWNSVDLVGLDDLFAPGVVMHLRGRSDVAGLDAYRGYNVGLRGTFPDQQWAAEDLLAEDDKVVLVWTLRGTHRGELMGLAPTGKEVAVTGISVYRIADGKVAEIWVQSDTLGLLQQIGAIPTPGQAAG
jgi:predicted ester cyclase